MFNIERKLQMTGEPVITSATTMQVHYNLVFLAISRNTRATAEEAL